MSEQDLPLRAAILPVTPLQQNCTLLWCTKTMKGVVIDPGGDVELIRRAITESKVDIEAIVLTHGHIDHAGGAMELKESLRVQIIGPHKDDKFLLDSLAQTGPEYGMADARNCTPDKWLNEGEQLTVGELVFDILHCPGHSPGSLVFVNETANFAIVGDVLFQGSIGRTDLPGGDHTTLIRSITEKLFKLSNDVVFICGHGPASTIGQERQSNPFVGENIA